MKIKYSLQIILVCSGLQPVMAQAQGSDLPRRPAVVPRTQFPDEFRIPPTYRSPGIPEERKQGRDADQQSRPAVGQQITHLRLAAENLTRAGFEQEAADLRARAAALERELVRDLPLPVLEQESLLRELKSLRTSLDLLREEVQTLRYQLRVQNQSEADIDFAPAKTPWPRVEGHLRLPDRGARISDEELDAAPHRRPDFRRTPAKGSPQSSTLDTPSEVEFELVPVPVPFEAESESGELAPTPVPVPVPSEKSSR